MRTPLMVNKVYVVCVFSAFAFVGCSSNSGQNAVPQVPPGQARSTPAVNVPPSPTPVPTATPDPSVAPTPTPTPTPTPSCSPPPSGGHSSLGVELGIPDELDLRYFDGPVFAQFWDGSTAFAIAAAIDNVLHQKGIRKLVSERHIQSSFEKDEDDDLEAAIRATECHRYVDERVWPVESLFPLVRNYLEHASIRVTITQKFERDWKRALQAIGRDHKPLVVSIRVPVDLEFCAPVIRPDSRITRREHRVEAVGYQLDDRVEGGGYFIIKNSWGRRCGDAGYHYFPFEACKREEGRCEFVEIKDVESGRE